MQGAVVVVGRVWRVGGEVCVCGWLRLLAVVWVVMWEGAKEHVLGDKKVARNGCGGRGELQGRANSAMRGFLLQQSRWASHVRSLWCALMHA